MATFTAAQLEYLNSQRLGRLATVDTEGRPHVVPVGFRYNPALGTVDIAGYDMEQTRKYRNARDNGNVAFVVDDIQSTNPWQVKGVQIRGRATVTQGGEGTGLYGGPLIRILPEKVVAWGIEVR